MWRFQAIFFLTFLIVVHAAAAEVDAERQVMSTSSAADASALFVPESVLQARCGLAGHEDLENYIRMVKFPELFSKNFRMGVPDCFPLMRDTSDDQQAKRDLLTILEHQPSVLLGEVIDVVPGWSPALHTVMEHLVVQVTELLKPFPGFASGQKVSVLRLGGVLHHGEVALCFEGVTGRDWKPGDRMMVVATAAGKLLTERYDFPASDGVVLYLLPLMGDLIDIGDYPELTTSFQTLPEIRRELGWRAGWEGIQ